jgi:hypothetical protein
VKTLINKILEEARFDIVSPRDKAFIAAFDNAIAGLGYDFGGRIGDGYCWGPYMIIYAKTGVKAKKVAARIYIREDGIVLRLFFSKIDAHSAFIEQAPLYIREVFTGPHADCNFCENKKDGLCSFRKTYTLDGRTISKCSGVAFEFHEPDEEKLPDYMALLAEFYPPPKRK